MFVEIMCISMLNILFCDAKSALFHNVERVAMCAMLILCKIFSGLTCVILTLRTGRITPPGMGQVTRCCACLCNLCVQQVEWF